MKKIVRLNESELVDLIKKVISEDDYSAGYESNQEWLDWKAERDEALQKQHQIKNHILSTLHNFNTCLEATKQEIIEQYPALRMASMFSWADDITDLTMYEQRNWDKEDLERKEKLERMQRMRELERAQQRERMNLGPVSRELERMRSPDYSLQNDIDKMQQQADDSRARVFQQVRDRHERQKENYAHLKPYMRLYRTINEVILLTEQVTINPYRQGIHGLEKLTSAAEFLVDHTEGIDSYIIKGVKRCHDRFVNADLLNAKKQYLRYEHEYEELLNTQPTHTLR